jgi:hypothetical protein
MRLCCVVLVALSGCNGCDQTGMRLDGGGGNCDQGPTCMSDR